MEERQPGSRPVLVPDACLGLAVGVSGRSIAWAAQLFPVLEFTGGTAPGRRREGPHDLYRSASCRSGSGPIWPNVFGIRSTATLTGERLALPRNSARCLGSVAYLGAIPLILALGSLSLSRRPAWRSG